MEASQPREAKKRKGEPSSFSPAFICELPIEDLVEIARKLERDDLEALMNTALQSPECWKFGRILLEIYLKKFRRPDPLGVFELFIWIDFLWENFATDGNPRDEARDEEFEAWYGRNFDFGHDWRWEFGLATADGMERAKDLLVEEISKGIDERFRTARVLKAIKDTIIVVPHDLGKIYADERLEIALTGEGNVTFTNGDETDFKMSFFLAFINPDESLLEGGEEDLFD